jgi:cytidylate kinase
MPIVTVSRQFGAGGSEVAARVADALGWPLLDNALLDEVASRLGTSRAAVAARDERRPSLAMRLADALALGAADAEAVVAAGLEGAAALPNEERVLEVTQRVIVEAAARGPVVVVGRGAQAALASRADALHVLCVAPRGARVARVTEREGLAPAAAARHVDEMDRERATLVRRRWGRELLDASHYDVAVNTARLGVGGAATLVLDLVRARFAQAPPGTG